MSIIELNRVIFNGQVVDNDGKEVASGEEGDIAVRYKPERPVGMFTKYLVVSLLLKSRSF